MARNGRWSRRRLSTARTVTKNLAEFLRRQTGSEVAVSGLRRYTVGFSWITYGFEASWRDSSGPRHEKLILRLGPPEGPLRAVSRVPAVRRAQGARGLGGAGPSRLLVQRRARPRSALRSSSARRSRAKRLFLGSRRVTRRFPAPCARGARRAVRGGARRYPPLRVARHTARDARTRAWTKRSAATLRDRILGGAPRSAGRFAPTRCSNGRSPG